MQRKTALITGITGQDGSYLAEFLLEQGYQVVGIARRISTEPPARLRSKKLLGQIKLVSGDLLDGSSLMRVLQAVKPDEVYNLAAQSFVPDSWQQPELTGQVNALGVTRLLEAIRIINPSIRFYQASTSEMFGNSLPPQSEDTPFHPRSPYAVAKLYGHWITVNYRESYGLYACLGILFNHESPRRGPNFVTQKIARHVASLHLGQTDKPLELGNLEARRDWGYAPDYVRATWLMLQQPEPSDYVIGTGTAHSVRDFVEMAFAVTGVNIVWEGEGVSEAGRDQQCTDRLLVVVNPTFYRPAETNFLAADPAKAYCDLGWQPTIDFDQLVKIMVKSAIASFSK